MFFDINRRILNWQKSKHIYTFIKYIIWKLKYFYKKKMTFISTITCTTVVKHIGEVMVSIFTLSVINFDIELQSYQIKDFKIGICYLSTKQVV
jgi:hypothetical protein